jgi:hypothetical protein
MYIGILLGAHPFLHISRIRVKGKYDLRPAIKNVYQLRPKVSALRVSIASRVVNSRHEELCPAVIKELYQLHPKTWVYKMSNNLKVLTEFYCTLYTIICKHRKLTTQLLYYVIV